MKGDVMVMRMGPDPEPLRGAAGVRRGIFALLLVTTPALAERPVIDPNGVVNAASFAGSDQPGWAIAPGSIASVFGRNLAVTAREADSLPLPQVLEGTSVTVDGMPAPLFYVSPTQINFQVPSAVIDFHQPGRGPRPVPVVVTTQGGVSEPLLVQAVQSAAGIFTQSAQGCGQGAILNVGTDGSRTVNTPAQSATPGSFISVYATGVGPVNFGHRTASPPRPRSHWPARNRVLVFTLVRRGFPKPPTQRHI